MLCGDRKLPAAAVAVVASVLAIGAVAYNFEVDIVDATPTDGRRLAQQRWWDRKLTWRRRHAAWLAAQADAEAGLAPTAHVHAKQVQYPSPPPTPPISPAPLSPPSPPTPTAWVVGGELESCDTACGNINLACTEDQLLAHNADIASEVMMNAKLAELNQPFCHAFWAMETYGSNDNVPNFAAKNGKIYCALSNPERHLKSFGCSATPPAASYFMGPAKRICNCI
jgi:hypothetical protein